MNKELSEVSKFLSYVLRHEPQAIGLTLNQEGWVSINELIACATKNGKTINQDLINTVVETNDKKRFEISSNGLQIRAVQGHSAQSVNLSYTPTIPPETLFHGTATRFLDSILSKGLLSGVRQYVHLSHTIQTAIEVGQRHGKPVVLEIKAQLMHQQGFIFFQAQNGVWLTDHVPIEFLSSINSADSAITSKQPKLSK
jgi:putative RNA 2'-phosphotransferase